MGQETPVLSGISLVVSLALRTGVVGSYRLCAVGLSQRPVLRWPQQLTTFRTVTGLTARLS